MAGGAPARWADRRAARRGRAEFARLATSRPPQLEHFSRRHRVIAIDQRGFGTSDKPEQAYSIEGFADDAAWLCSELGVDAAVVIGHSLGGAVALALGARRPDLCSALALCDPAVFLPAWAFEHRNEIVAGLASPGYRGVIRLFADRHLFLDSDDAERRRWILDIMCTAPQHVLSATLEAMYAFDAESAARACRGPTLCIVPGQPLVGASRLQALCPQLELASTEEVGHFHPLLAPAAANAHLERFLLARTNSEAIGSPG